jgi:hypothetical protein
MRKNTIRALITVCALIVFGTVAAAPRGWRGSGGWSQDGAYGRLFDPKTMTSITGEITAIDRFAPMRGMGAGIHLTVKTKSETFDVHLGPAWYIESQDIVLERGDSVVISGSRVVMNKKPAIIAVELERDGDVLVLRDSNGFPRWAGWRRGRAPST